MADDPRFYKGTGHKPPLKPDCPSCGKRAWRVINTRSGTVLGRPSVWRKRDCLKCGYRYETFELDLDFLKELLGNYEE